MHTDEHGPYDEIQNEKLIEEVAKTMSRPPNNEVEYIANNFKSRGNREIDV